MQHDLIEKIAVTYDILIKYGNTVLLDSKLASVLKLVESKGSILAASKEANIPYSRVWEMIVKAERLLGDKLIITWKGGKGGGSKLTNTAKQLLEVYDSFSSRFRKCLPEIKLSHPVTTPKLFIAHSDDPVLEVIIRKLVDSGVITDQACVGSGRAFALLAAGEADIACGHLYDPVSDAYNTSILKELGILDNAIKLGVYERELVIAVRRDSDLASLKSYRDVILKIIKESRKLACRNPGSGTYMYLTYLLNEVAKEYQTNSLCRHFYSHHEAAKAVALEKADATLTLKNVASTHGLKTYHVRWEKYECYSLNKTPYVNEFANILRSRWLRNYIRNIIGYRLP